MFRRTAISFAAITFTAYLALSASSAQAEVKPFKVTGAGTADHMPAFAGDEAAHWAEGQATELGEDYCEPVVRLDDFTSPTTGDFSNAAPCVFTAANGDELVFNYAGTVELIPTEDEGVFVTKWTATFTPDVAHGRLGLSLGEAPDRRGIASLCRQVLQPGAGNLLNPRYKADPAEPEEFQKRVRFPATAHLFK